MRKPKTIQLLAAQKFEPGADLPTEIELLQVGDWQAPWKGHIVNTVEAFNQMVDNFNNGAGKFQPDNKLPINLDHQKIEAAGWINGLEVRGNSLWGTGIEWTPLGEQKLRDREFSYLSSEWSPIWQNPLDEDELVDNVFEGAALTNYPLFSTLEPLVANKTQKKDLTANSKNITLYMKGSTTMNLEDLLAKDHSELTDEEKAFIKEHQADLTEDQVTELTEAGILDAPEEEEEQEEEEEEESEEEEEEQEEEGQQASTKISAKELKQLKADAKAGREARESLRAMEASNKAEKLIISANNKEGRFLEASHSALTKFMLTLNASQTSQFNELIKGLPKVPLAASRGTSEESKTASTAAESLAEQADKLVADKKAANFGEAMKIVTANNKELVDQTKDEE